MHDTTFRNNQLDTVATSYFISVFMSQLKLYNVEISNNNGGAVNIHPVN